MVVPIRRIRESNKEYIEKKMKETEDNLSLSAKREKLKYDEEEPEEKFNVTQFLPRF